LFQRCRALTSSHSWAGLDEIAFGRIKNDWEHDRTVCVSSSAYNTRCNNLYRRHCLINKI
jgi:hypothetical protein